MFAKKTLAAGLVALSALVAVPANATNLSIDFGFGAPGYYWSEPNYYFDGGWGQHHTRMSPQQVHSILRNRGYFNIDFTDTRGAVYQLRATKHYQRYGLVVSARSGEILNRYPIRWR